MAWTSVNRFSNAVCQGQRSGKCRWTVRARCARRAATLMIRVRIEAVRAVALAPAARCPAARVRLWAIAAQVSQASLAENRPDGRCARGRRSDLLDDRVLPVLGFGLHQGERAVGEPRVIAVGR